MSRSTVTTLVIAAFFVPSIARAELPRLATDTPAAATPRAALPLLDKLEKLKQGTLHLSFTSVDYRWAENGMRAAVQFGRTSTSAVIGYDGAHRLELDWRLNRTSVKLALVTQDNGSGYRLALAHAF